ncbi:MAG: transglutaminase family protein [Deltaproteobacteria bacterium]|nr:transglutaminase family protein [Deltaproteobacteria bacterium]
MRNFARKFVVAFVVAGILVPVGASAEPGYWPADNDHRPASFTAPRSPARFHIRLTAEFLIRSNPALDPVVVTLPLPPNMHSQTVLDWRTDPAPSREIVSVYGYRFAEFVLGPGAPGQTLTVTYDADVELRAIRYALDPAQVQTPAAIPERIRLDYTGDGPYYRIDSPIVSRAASLATVGEAGLYERMLGIWRDVRRRLFFKGDGRKLDAARTLELGSGSCTEYSFAMIGMCRAAGIPARYTAGSRPRIGKGKTRGYDKAMHKTLEVYLPPYGWVPVEPSNLDRDDGVDRSSELIGTQTGRHFFFVIEPEPELVDLDAKRNALTDRAGGTGMVRYRSKIWADWTLIEKGRALPPDEFDVLPENDEDEAPGSLNPPPVGPPGAAAK